MNVFWGGAFGKFGKLANNKKYDIAKKISERFLGNFVSNK